MANKIIITDTPHSLLKNKICSSLYFGKEQEGTNSLSLSLLVLSLVLFFAPSFLLGTKQRMMDHYPRRTADSMPQIAH